MGIYIWGTGCGAAELFQKGLSLEKITAFIDNHPSSDTFSCRPVLRPEDVFPDKINLILVASRHLAEISKQAHLLGFPKNKLLFLRDHYQLNDLNTSYETAEKLLGQELLAKICPSWRMIQVPSGAPDNFLSFSGGENDYIRYKTVEFLSSHLTSCPGALAELGVYQGIFARFLNQTFPDRKLYLFDSFKGFDTLEALQEKNAGNCSDAFLEVHKNTAIEKVREQMPFPDQVCFYPGYFPESLHGLEETFALVSLDADFEDSTYAGLVYFWPRMISGGYILLHDYNSSSLTGVKQALRRYETDMQIHLPAVPLCDINGTLVLCKP